MFEPYFQLIRSWTDKTVKWTTKIFHSILFFASLILINNTIDFVNTYRISNKITQLEQITALLKDSTISDNIKFKLIKFQLKNQWFRRLAQR